MKKIMSVVLLVPQVAFCDNNYQNNLELWRAVGVCTDQGSFFRPSGEEQVLQALRNLGNPNTTNQTGNTVLYTALLNGCSEATILGLIQAGVDLKAKSSQGRAPLHAVAIAQKSNNPHAVIKLLLAYGAAVDPKDNNYKTPADFAVARCNKAALQAFIKQGAERTIKPADFENIAHCSSDEETKHLRATYYGQKS